VRDVAGASSVGGGFQACGGGPTQVRARQLPPDFPAPIRKVYFRPLVSELFRHVRLVGAIHMDSAVSIVARRTGRARIWRNGDVNIARGSESRRDVSGLCGIRLGSGSTGTPAFVHPLYVCL